MNEQNERNSFPSPANVNASQYSNERECTNTYTAKSGDTLYSIAKRYDVSASELMKINKIRNPYALRVGQIICIPGEEVQQNECRTTHLVAEGDTLYMIAGMHNISLDDLINSNPQLDPYNLQIGSILCIPGSSAIEQQNSRVASNMEIAGDDLPSEETISLRSDPQAMNGDSNVCSANCSTGKPYSVRRGEKLSDILVQNNMCFASIMCCNMDVDFSKPLNGITLCLPTSDSLHDINPRNSYVVRQGDNLDLISEKSGIPASELLIFNPCYTPSDFSTRGLMISLGM